eukprot:601174-Hanusia_phi.AAC.1
MSSFKASSSPPRAVQPHFKPEGFCHHFGYAGSPGTVPGMPLSSLGSPGTTVVTESWRHRHVMRPRRRMQRLVAETVAVRVKRLSSGTIELNPKP